MLLGVFVEEMRNLFLIRRQETLFLSCLRIVDEQGPGRPQGHVFIGLIGNVTGQVEIIDLKHFLKKESWL